MSEVAAPGHGLRIDTPAKVNLSLRVLGVRSDGYHDLESVVAAVALFDTLDFLPADDICLVCDSPEVPAGEDNLVVRAARLLAERCGVRTGAKIRLTKRIPPGRGFGGGSSDAAATLVGLNKLWRTGLDGQALAAIGATLGSDIPVFLGPPVSIMRGRGERVEAVPAGCRWHVVLAWPDFGLSTAEVYAAYDRMDPVAADRLPATEIVNRLDRPAAEVGECLVNDLEPAAAQVRGDGMDVREILEFAGAAAIGMTGSGSAYFALADTETEARQVAEEASAAGAETVVTTFLSSPGSMKEAQP